MVVARVAILTLLAALAGCQRRDSGADTGRPTTGTNVPAATQVIHGRATYRERLKMAPGASLRVQLLAARVAGAPAAVVAQTTLADVAGPPYDFALRYDPARIGTGVPPAVRAALHAADGSLLFDTPAPVPVAPGDAATTVIVMRRATAGEPHPLPPRLDRTRWTCAGLTFEAAIDGAGGRVELALPEGVLSLPLAVSASGARYADHRGNEFRTRGASGTLTRAGGARTPCVRQDAAPAADSPWDAARRRGIAFRAVGNEPGWFAEVGPGQTPQLHAELDYGDRSLEVARLQALSGRLGYAGTSAQGERVRLLLERTPCSDGMSDARYPVAVTLELDDRTWRGCGRFIAR